MGQPALIRASGRAVAKFGNAALPNGQGVMANIDLNDLVNTALNAPLFDGSNRQISLAQLLYRGRGVYLADDFGPGLYSLPMLYLEDATHFLGQFLAALSQAGEQQLTFDNATYNLVKFKGITGRTRERPVSMQSSAALLAWSFTLELIAKSPWWQDAAATTATPWNPITVDAGQGANITYAGSVWAEPVWTLDVPVGNAVAINAFQLRNTMSGEFLTVNFLSRAALPAGVHTVITIDCAAKTVTDQNGNFYDTAGTFPLLYPPAGQVNPFTAIVTPASGASAGLTLAQTHFPRWQL